MLILLFSNKIFEIIYLKKIEKGLIFLKFFETYILFIFSLHYIGKLENKYNILKYKKVFKCNQVTYRITIYIIHFKIIKICLYSIICI